MTTIRIRQSGKKGEHFQAVVSFDGGGEYPITISDPFTQEQEERLEWYFEEYLRQPFLDKVKYERAATSVTEYGEKLFQQVFNDPDSYAEYKSHMNEDTNSIHFEIAGESTFHVLHWETLKDPKLHQPLSLRSPMVRKHLKPQPFPAKVKSSPWINILIVTARPHGRQDVAYRTISRPMIEALRTAKMHAQIDILRPGTYEALSKQLERKKPGHYHVIHFDVHGSLLKFDQFNDLQRAQEELPAEQLLYQLRFGRPDLKKYEGFKAFLALEGDNNKPYDLVEADELQKLLTHYQVPVVILNACQSGKQVGARETSLGNILMRAGAQLVVAMGYSVTVSAAKIMMKNLYEQLFAQNPLSEAIRLSRLELFHNKNRRAYHDQNIELEDWMLPIVYQSKDIQLEVRDFTPEENRDHFEKKVDLHPFPEPHYGFVGRDLDILEIEKGLLSRHNILLVRGMGGAGKTTLLHHLCAWWQRTDFVDRVFYFAYDQKAWNRQQIMQSIADQLLDPVERAGNFEPLSEEAKQILICEKLRSHRHVLVLDNMESITGARLAVQHTLSEQEQKELHSFLSHLVEGETIVLFGSRGGEEWLASVLKDNVYELGGLDPEAASTLAEKVLEKYETTSYHKSEEFQKLLTLLQGYPLVLEVILPNLQNQSPQDILQALDAGDVLLDKGDTQSKTESILRCIEYSHSNLSPEAQELLCCLAPFTSVIYRDGIEQFTEFLKKQTALGHLQFDMWSDVLQEAMNWGLLSPHPQASPFLQLQPIFPYFLKTRLEQSGQVRQGIETAFWQYYTHCARQIGELVDSKEPDKRQYGKILVSFEFENLSTALNSALHAQASIIHIYDVLSSYLEKNQEYDRSLELCKMIMAGLTNYSEDKLSGTMSLEIIGIVDTVALCQLQLKHYPEAEQSYQKGLSLISENKILEHDDKNKLMASTYHQLGIVAQKQRQWKQAEHYYKKALEIKIELKTRYEQAGTYHQLGIVAEEQRQWKQAEQYYKKALEIKIEFKARYEQAITYHQLGMVAQKQRQLEQAEQYYKKALEIKIEFKDRYEQASTYHQLGRVAQEQRQLEQAEQYYKKALEIQIELKARYEQAATYHQLGIVAQEQRQWKQAEQYYKKALEIKIEFKDRYVQAAPYHQLGRVAEEQRQWKQAEQYYKKALEIQIELKTRSEQAATYHQLGIVAEEQRQWKQASSYYVTALQIFVEFNDRHFIGITLRNIFRFVNASGNRDIFSEVAGELKITLKKVEEFFSDFNSSQADE